MERRSYPLLAHFLLRWIPAGARPRSYPRRAPPQHFGQFLGGRPGARFGAEAARPSASASAGSIPGQRRSSGSAGATELPTLAREHRGLHPRPLPREELVGDDAEDEDVARGPRVLRAVGELGRHVDGRPHERARLGQELAPGAVSLRVGVVGRLGVLGVEGERIRRPTRRRAGRSLARGPRRSSRPAHRPRRRWTPRSLREARYAEVGNLEGDVARGIDRDEDVGRLTRSRCARSPSQVWMAASPAASCARGRRRAKGTLAVVRPRSSRRDDPATSSITR